MIFGSVHMSDILSLIGAQKGPWCFIHGGPDNTSYSFFTHPDSEGQKWSIQQIQ